MTVDELRALGVESDLSDEALQTFLDAAEAMVAAAAGSALQITEEHRGDTSTIILYRFCDAADLESITEADTVAALDPSLYRLQADGRTIVRLDEGSDQYSRFAPGPVLIVYTPRDFAALRDVAAAMLVRGSLAGNPGVLGLTEGNFSIQYQNGETWSSGQDDALSVVRPPWSFA